MSFLACAGCNPFTDDTKAIALNHPKTEPPTANSGYRMKHILEAEVSSSDGKHIDQGSPRIINSIFSAGESGYCGQSFHAAIISSNGPASPVGITSRIHGEGVEWTSEFVTRLGASVLPTLPFAPCGPLGHNNKILAISNKFHVRIFADGVKKSGFDSASSYPFHYLYEDGSLKIFNRTPVRPTVNFTAWATSTGQPKTLGEIGLKALKFACCNPNLSKIVILFVKVTFLFLLAL